jgi:hypothetical protein
VRYGLVPLLKPQIAHNASRIAGTNARVFYTSSAHFGQHAMCTRASTANGSNCGSGRGEAARPLARREQAALPLRVDLLRTGAALFTRRPGPAVRGSASVETNEQARHPAFGIGVGRSTHEKVGVDGGIGHLLLDVFFRFAMRYGGLQ